MGHLSCEKWPAPDAAPNGRPYTSAHLCEFITDGSPVHPLYWAHLSKEVAYGFAKTPPKNGKDRGGLRGLRLLCPRLSLLRHPNLERYHSPGGCRPMRRLRQVRGGVPGYHNYTGGESPMKSAGMTSSGSPLSSIWCWASSTSSLPGWASSAFSSLWSSPLRAGIRATATAFVDGDSCSACWVDASASPGGPIFPGG